MHIPEIERALSELIRVTTPGGVIVLSENNWRSWHSRSLRTWRRLSGRPAVQHWSDAGFVRWETTADGPIITRHADPSWLVTAARTHGAELIERLPGEFTQLYADMPWRFVRRMIHTLNAVWFRVGPADPALGNLFVLRRLPR